MEEIQLLNYNIITESIVSSTYADCYYEDIINGTEANKKGFTGKDVTIAVLDTGVDINHYLLKGKIIDCKNFTNEGQ